MIKIVKREVKHSKMGGSAMRGVDAIRSTAGRTKIG